MLRVSQLAGFMLPPSLVVRRTVLSATATTANITIPAAAQIGDFAILVDLAGAVGEPSNVVPTNWTSIQTQGDGSTTRISASGKILVSGDPGAAITGMNDTDMQKVMLVFRGSSPFKGFTASTWNEEVTGGNPSAQTVTAVGQEFPIIVFGAAGEADDGTPAFSTESPAFDASVSANSDLIVGYKVYNGTPSNHSIDMADLGNANALVSGYVILT